MDKKTHAIEGEMTICRAAELRHELLELCEAERDIEIDLSSVTEIDSAGLQLMVAMKIESLAREGTLRFTRHSQAVQDALELAELGGFFGDPVLITTH